MHGVILLPDATSYDKKAFHKEGFLNSISPEFPKTAATMPAGIAALNGFPLFITRTFLHIQNSFLTFSALITQLSQNLHLNLIY